MKKIVIFGAGNIGRSFIAPVFSRGGYEAVFADVAPKVLDALDSRSSYTLVEKTDSGDRSFEIGPVRGVDARDSDAVKSELEGSDICVTCVGAAALPVVLKTISQALNDRKKPLDVILAENLKGAGELAGKILPDRNRVGIIDTSIGKMVPVMPADIAAADPLICWAEPYNTLIVDRDGFIGPVPEIADLTAVSPVEPWVARKLYIHNFGHAAAAYLGFQAYPDARCIWEVLADPLVADKVRKAMSVSGKALMLEHPGVFSPEEIEDHISDLIERFSNRALGDTLHRVGRDLGRKLKLNDRVVGAISLALKHGLEPQIDVFSTALDFRAAGPAGIPDAGDLAVIESSKNPSAFLRETIGLEDGSRPELQELLITALERHRAH